MMCDCLVMCLLLLLLRSVQGLYLEPVQEHPSSATKFLNVVEGQDAVTLYCRGLTRDVMVRWTVDGEVVGKCPNPEKTVQGRKLNSCYDRDPARLYKPERTSSVASSLTLDLQRVDSSRTLGGQRVECRTERDSDAVLINYIYRAECSGCWVEVKRWKVEGWCDVNKVYSTAIAQHYCNWDLELKGRQFEMSTEFSLSGENSNSSFLSGTCRLDDNDFPGVTGTLRYQVELTGGVKLTPQFVGDNAIEVPKVPTIKCYPEGSQEVSYFLLCTCKTGSVGQPTGRLQWSQILTNGDIVPVHLGAFGDTELDMGPRKLRQRDKGSLFRCDVIWAFNLTGPSFFVPHAPRFTSPLKLSINYIALRHLSVDEGQKVRLDCYFHGRWPRDVMTLTLTTQSPVGEEEVVEVAGNSSSVHHLFRSVQCQQAGRYQCRFSSQRWPDVGFTATTTLYVHCTPRVLNSTELSLYYRGGPSSLHIDVIAYPVPVHVIFTPLGPASVEMEEEMEGEEAGDVTLEGNCVAGDLLYVAHCELRVTYMTSSAAEGMYDVKIFNQGGFGRLTVHVFYDERIQTTASPERTAVGTAGPEKEENTPAFVVRTWMVVVMGVGTLLLLLLVTAVVVVVCQRRKGRQPKETRQRELHYDSASQLHSSSKPEGEMSEIYIYPAAMSPQLHHTGAACASPGHYYTDAVSEPASSSHVYSEIMDYQNAHAHHTDPTPEDQGGHYDDLDMTQVGPTVYSRLKP